MNASTRTPTNQSPGSAPLSRRRPASALPGHSVARRLAPALLACALLAGPALAAAPGERPRPQDFPNYGSYVKALVDYQRALETPPKKEEKKIGVDDSKLCRDTQGGSEDDKKKNNCEGKYLVVENPLPDDAEQKPKKAAAEPPPPVQYEDLEETISRNSSSYSPGSGPSGTYPDLSPRSLPLEEIPAADLSEAGVSGLLGLFDNVRMTSLGGSAAPGGIFGAATGGSSAGGSGGGIDPDGTLIASLEGIVIQLSTLDLGQLADTVIFGDGYSIVRADVRIAGDGLSIGLSSETYTSFAIVDSDGLPGTRWAGAGALTLDRMAILIPYVEANIRSVRTSSSDSSLLQLDAYSPGPIFVDFSDSSIGVAPATRDGRWIGDSTAFVRFGPDSVLTIGAGTRVRAVVSKPDGLTTAFVTLNGRIGDISINDVRVVDPEAGGSIGFGRLAVGGLDLVDARLYMNDRSVVIDTGRSLSDISVDIERFYLGNDGGGSFIGDFYARGGRLENLRLTATPH